jgi:exoribonuclease II
MMETDSHHLRSLAVRALLEYGFLPVFSSQVNGELAAIQTAPPFKLKWDMEDLRELFWTSIDNETSKDLDQLEYVEKLEDGSFKLLIAIADVDTMVPQDSAIDQHARTNTTSIYAGFIVFPMLPDMLSANKTSLLPEQDRLATVTEMIVTPEGVINEKRFFKAFVRNQIRLNYDEVSEWLDCRENNGQALLRGNQQLTDQLLIQYELTNVLAIKRLENGALNFESMEVNPVMEDGKIVGLEVLKNGRSRMIVQTLMITANSVMADFLNDHDRPSLRRIVRKPARWHRIMDIARQHGTELPSEPDPKPLAAFLSKMQDHSPELFGEISLSVLKLIGQGEYVVQEPGQPSEGHFGLAVQDYTHSTAPNRRYIDLIIQRLLKSVLSETDCPYTADELNAIAKHCMERESAARTVERMLRKMAAATLLSSEIGNEFDGIVTGVKSTGTFVRLNSPPAEGRIVRGEKGLDVGDKVRVKLTATDIERGHIDFAAISN